MTKIKDFFMQVSVFKIFLERGIKSQIQIISAIFVVLVLSVTLFLNSSKKVHDLPAILKAGRINVLTDGSSLGFAKNNGNVIGFQYELVKAFADSLGVELVISEENDLKNGINEIKNGDYDLIAMLVPITTEWKNKVLFTVPILTSKQVLVQMQKLDTIQSNMISKHRQLANDTIFISGNSPFKMRLLHLSNEIAGNIHIEEMKDLNTEQMVRLVSEGKIKNTICDQLFAIKLQKKYPNLDITVPIGFEQQQAWILNPKSKKLLEKLNEFLTDFIGTSAYWNIYRKYY